MEAAGYYEPLPSMPEDGGEGGGSVGGAPPDALLGSEQYQWEAVPNLDQFFTRIYRYWEEKGFVVMLTSRVLNLLALAFTVAMSALLLLYVNWGALQADCLKKDTCDIWEVAVRKHPLAGGVTVWTSLAATYLVLFSAYWLAALAHLVYEVRDLTEIKHFCNQKLGISERQMGTVTWPEVAHRLVEVQKTNRLCTARDLSEHDIVSRVMRKENYLVGMLNKGVLALNVPIPGFRRHFLLTKTLEWNLYWCVLDAMFDDHFRLKPSFLHNEQALQQRLRVLAVFNLAASPFLLVFLIIYFFMKNAEKFYHHPSSVGARRWSPLAKWRLREFNELPHFISHRLNASHKAAEEYIQQFPNPALGHAARFVAFVAGSVAALLLFVTLIDERLLERDLFGRQLVWWVAVVGVVLALSRAFVIEAGTAFDPEFAMLEVVAHTHYLPQHWRGRAHTREVQQEFQALFQFKALLFLEELSSILLTPLLLWFSLPQCAGAVLSFVEQNTVHVEGVGDVCSLAAFDFQRHGNAKYGATADAPKLYRSRQGKMEKSFLSFAATYPAWEPNAAGQQLLQQVSTAAPAAAGGQQSLGFSLLLPHQQRHQAVAAAAAAAATAPHGLLRQSLLAGGWQQQQQHPLQQQRQQQLLAAALAAGGAMDASFFGSAELTGADGRQAASLAASMAAASLAPAGGVGAQLDRMCTSQLLLQSLYEQRRQQQQPLQQAPFQQQGNGALSIAGFAAPAAAPAGQQQQQPQQQGALPIPQQQRQQQQQEVVKQWASASRPASASPSQQQQQQRGLLQQQQQQAPGPASSPRQTWLGRSPSGRARVSELSVLSRENSSAGEHRAAAAAGGGMPAPGPAAAATGGVSAGQQQQWQQQAAAGEAAAPSSGTPPSPTDSLLLQQHLLLQGSGQHSSELHSSGLHTSSGGDSEGPPDIF